MNKNNSKKNFVWNMIGVTLNAFNSLFFMIIVTRINGIKDAGIFTFAFSTATLFNIIGVYSGRVYQVTDKTNATDKDFIVSKIITCIMMTLVSILFILINNYNLHKSFVILLLCILKMLEAFVEVIYAILQKYDCLYQVGISLTLKSLASLLAFLIADIITKNVIFSIISMIVVHILIMIFYDFKCLKNSSYKSVLSKSKNVKSILKKGFNAFVISFLILYLINSSKYVMDYILEEQYQTIYGILLMPATVILLFTQYILNPFLNTINNYIKDNDYQQLKKLVIKFLIIMTILGVIVLIVASTLGIPVLELIYGIDLIKYRSVFIVVMLGAVLYGMSSIFSNILIAMRHLSTQVVIYFITSIIITIVSYFLISKYGVFGACYSYFFMTFIIFFLFLIMTFIFIRMDGVKNETC